MIGLMIMRKLRKPIKYTLVGIGILALSIHYIWYTNDIKERREEKVSFQPFVEMAQLETVSTEIFITNYFLGDNSSGTTTASGKQIKDFGINEQGMYTFNGMIVVATANTERLNWPLNEGYRSHSLYSVLNLEIEGTSYEAIVLDICGSCYGVKGEEKQRYDIFTTGNIIGKVDGKLIETQIKINVID